MMTWLIDAATAALGPAQLEPTRTQIKLEITNGPEIVDGNRLVCGELRFDYQVVARSPDRSMAKGTWISSASPFVDYPILAGCLADEIEACIEDKDSAHLDFTATIEIRCDGIFKADHTVKERNFAQIRRYIEQAVLIVEQEKNRLAEDAIENENRHRNGLGQA